MHLVGGETRGRASLGQTPGLARKSLRPTTREAIYGYVFISPWLGGFLVLTLGPMVAALVISFYRTDFLTTTYWVGLKWWGSLLTDQLVHKAFINTFYFAAVSVPAKTVMALMIAVLLNQGIRGQSFWRTVYYLPSVVSGVAVSILFAWLYHPDVGLINTLLRYVGIHGPAWLQDDLWAMPSMILMSLWGAGAPMIIYLAGMRGIPTVLYEAAQIDGAGPIRRFFSITIPMLSPTILFNLVMNLIGSWQVFTQAYVMTEGGPNNATLTMVLHIYRTAFSNGYFGYASAQAWGLFIVVLALVLLALRSTLAWVQYERV